LDVGYFGAIATAHPLACLRIARSVSGSTARLASDLLGSALVGRDSHPLDDKQDFVKSLHLQPLLSGMAWSLLRMSPFRMLCAAL
jgi:hypothetical protein